MWDIYTVQRRSAIKGNKIMPFAATWMDLEMIMLSDTDLLVRQRRTSAIRYHLHVESKARYK